MNALKSLTAVATVLLALGTAEASAKTEQEVVLTAEHLTILEQAEMVLPQQPCGTSIAAFIDDFRSDWRTRAAFWMTLEGLQELPAGYEYHDSSVNPWAAQNYVDLFGQVVTFYNQVCTLLPQIVGTNDNALDSIQYFAWLYYRNDAGRDFVQGDIEVLGQDVTSMQRFLIAFNEEYKAYMDSSASTGKVAEWVADPRLEIEDYVFQNPEDYPSWNAFFARNLKFDPISGTYPTRPVTMAGRDYVITSPTDCIMNPLVQNVMLRPGLVQQRFIENPLQLDDVLDVKGLPISVTDMLANTPDSIKKAFDGGTGLACVLMPNTYHHFHSPVDGTIVHAEIVEAGSDDAYGTFGYDDWPNWVPEDGNVGRPGTDFSQFQGFTRGVIIIRVQYKNLPGKKPDMLTGYVASIPVGLDTVGSVVFHDGVVPGAAVKKGVTPFGNFFFGGSLNIMLFSTVPYLDDDGSTKTAQMVSPAVQTRMGNQIGIMNTPYAPPKTPWTPN